MGYASFLMVGAVKKGTTSLSSWLGAQAACERSIRREARAIEAPDRRRAVPLRRSNVNVTFETRQYACMSSVARRSDSVPGGVP
jgi:hypothetical protein